MKDVVILVVAYGSMLLAGGIVGYTLWTTFIRSVNCS